MILIINLFLYSYRWIQFRFLVGKPEGKNSLGRIRRSWEDKTILDIRQIGWGYGLDSSGTGQRPVAGSCEHGNKHSGSIKCWEFLECRETLGF
jgi:hypothetical protein